LHLTANHFTNNKKAFSILGANAHSCPLEPFDSNRIILQQM